MSWAWQILGIAPTAEAAAIRRAYADKLRALDIDRDAAAYANLREARDWALRWAKENPDGPIDTGEEEPQGGDDDLFGNDDFVFWSADQGAGEGDWDEQRITLPQGLSFQAPQLPASAEAPAGDTVRIEHDHDRKLHALLYPGGEAEEAALSEEELAEARRHLDAILVEAEGGNLAAHDAIESWLAPTLAGSWPRCAPLLESAESCFQWSRQRGQLGERPAVAFLNDRLRGMRFEQKVLDPAHPLHKAWLELVKPGRAGVFKGWGVNRRSVQQLLEGVRLNFPELEHRFDPQRVASWETPPSNSAGSSGPGSWFWIFIVIAVVRLIGSFDDNRTTSSLPPRFAEQVITLDPVMTELVMTSTFGEGKSIAWLRGVSPEMALTIEANLRESARVKDDQGRTLVRVLGLVRERAYRARSKLSPADLENLMRVRYNQLVMARSVSAATCLDWLEGANYKSIGTLPDTQAKREQAFYANLAITQQLAYVPRTKPGSASVPGELVDRVIKASRLGEAQVRKAMGGEGSAETRCAVHIALIEQTLRWKGPERTAILKML